MFEGAKVVVVTPHADDETLGVGGTLMKYRFASLDIVLVATGSVQHRDGTVSSSEDRLREFTAVCNRLEAQPWNLGFPDRLVDMYMAKLVNDLDKTFDKIQPTVVFMPAASFHQDHRTTYLACHAALRLIRHPTVKQVLLYETGEYGWSVEREAFMPNLYVSISQELLEQKCALLAWYVSQGRADPNVCRRLAIKRGVECGLDYAEAFRIARWTDA